MWWWIPDAHAETPLPSYRDALVHQAWGEANDLLEGGHPEDAAASAEKFEAWVEPDGGLEYIVGLSWRIRGDVGQAQDHYTRALALDPSLAEGWYDLGEIQLSAGAYAEARDSFTRVADLVATGPHAYLGPQRLAEVAAHQHDPDAFEIAMREALRRGFSFEMIAGLPNWKGFYADPAMRDSVEKMITVFGSEETLNSLKGP